MIIPGDCIAGLQTLESCSVQCVVTSPPYWGLRDYGTAKWEGGAPDCDHSPEARGGRFASPVSKKQASNVGSGTASQRDCPCGARRIDSQLGLEPTPEEYVAHLVTVFREVRRVLRDDGTLWLNLGDTYAAGCMTGKRGPNSAFGPSKVGQDHTSLPARKPPEGLKPKDLVGIPWRVAFALQADGWWLRSDIIWSKPNPMPESITDRPTKAHEYLFLLAKSERYYYDVNAIREPHTTAGAEANTGQWEDTVSPKVGSDERFRTRPGSRPSGYFGHVLGRNRHTVWTVTVQPFSGAHFAVMPEALVEPCILAGSRVGSTIMDPFSGAGTVGLVAAKLGREFIGFELNPDYKAIADHRIFWRTAKVKTK